MAALLKKDADLPRAIDSVKELLPQVKGIGPTERKFFGVVTASSYREIRKHIREEIAKSGGSVRNASISRWQNVLDQAMNLAHGKVANARITKQQAMLLAAKGWLLHNYAEDKGDSNYEQIRA